jgi:uncharacterized membrane protein HdeD (DUF308 family)
MITNLTRRWWVFLVRGVFAILLAIVAFAQPMSTLFALVVVWGAYAVAEGAMALWAGFSDDAREQGRWFLIIAGVAGILGGVAAWLWPGLTAVVMLGIIAAWSIVRGVFEMAAAFALRKSIDNEWTLLAAGALSVLFGLLLLLRPGIGLLALVWLIAIYALISGVLQIVLAFRLRHLGRANHTHAHV